jgi:hypothetical protein
VEDCDFITAVIRLDAQVICNFHVLLFLVWSGWIFASIFSCSSSHSVCSNTFWKNSIDPPPSCYFPMVRTAFIYVWSCHYYLFHTSLSSAIFIKSSR